MNTIDEKQCQRSAGRLRMARLGTLATGIAGGMIAERTAISAR